MGFLWFGKNRDGPKETRNQSHQIKDFIKGVDVDNQWTFSLKSGARALRTFFGNQKSLIKELLKKLTIDYGKGFDETNLRKMRQFYLCFKKRDALRLELTLLYNPL